VEGAPLIKLKLELFALKYLLSVDRLSRTGYYEKYEEIIVLSGSRVQFCHCFSEEKKGGARDCLVGTMSRHLVEKNWASRKLSLGHQSIL
jgi:hypothetical protein